MKVPRSAPRPLPETQPTVPPAYLAMAAATMASMGKLGLPGSQPIVPTPQGVTT